MPVMRLDEMEPKRGKHFYDPRESLVESLMILVNVSDAIKNGTKAR